MVPSRLWFPAFLLFLAVAGCSGKTRLAPTSQPNVVLTGLSEPVSLETVDAVARPPLGWTQEPLKSSNRHDHQLWISPSGDTAYGIIKMKLPWPVGLDLVLWGFMNEMRRTEKEGVLLSKAYDESLPGMRFVAEGGKYKIRTNLFAEGWTAWAVYAGTLRARPVNEGELELAVRAREATDPGVP